MDINNEMIDIIVEEEFKKIDTDKSRFIDFNEYRASIKNSFKLLGIEMSDSAIEAHMKIIDSNNDKKITKEEYRNYFISSINSNY